MQATDASRELAKVENVLSQVERHLVAHNESMAALHLSEQVMQSPLTVAVIQSRNNLRNLQARLESEGVSSSDRGLIEVALPSNYDSRIWDKDE